MGASVAAAIEVTGQNSHDNVTFHTVASQRPGPIHRSRYGRSLRRIGKRLNVINPDTPPVGMLLNEKLGLPHPTPH
jgi:hypothetical protein